MEVEFKLNENGENVLFLPLKNETLKNINPKTILSFEEQSKINELPKQFYDCIIGITNLPYSPSMYSQISQTLKPGSSLIIQAPKEVEIKKSLLYAGFVNIDKILENENIVQWQAYKTSVQMTSAPLKLNQKSLNTNKVVKINTNDNSDDIELLDEDAILEHETEKVTIPTKQNISDDCDFGKQITRKPCKNCTCGRAEKLKNNNNNDTKVKITDIKDFKSSCNSCHLGDAFRCATCPYLGMPAFEVGNSVKLKNIDDT